MKVKKDKGFLKELLNSRESCVSKELVGHSGLFIQVEKHQNGEDWVLSFVYVVKEHGKEKRTLTNKFTFAFSAQDREWDAISTSNARLTLTKQHWSKEAKYKDVVFTVSSS